MSAKTCGNCKHGDIPPPKMSKHKVPRVLEVFDGPGKCLYSVVPVPMVERNTGYRISAWANNDATKCLCWEPKP
jgi:hypothetical protein